MNKFQNNSPRILPIHWFLVLVFSWCNILRKLCQLPMLIGIQSSSAREISWQFLTRLIQNLTLCNNCNLIPSDPQTSSCPLKVIIWQMGSRHRKFYYSKVHSKGDVRWLTTHSFCCKLQLHVSDSNHQPSVPKVAAQTNISQMHRPCRFIYKKFQINSETNEKV